MGVRSVLALLSLISLCSLGGCKKDPQKVEPETRGKRGENCQARNDCQAGLACLNGICGINEFDIKVEVKQCDRIECATTEDCCGDKPSEAPKACADRDKYCTQIFPGCSSATVCTSNTACNGGTCRPAPTLGTCSGGALSGSTCETAAECQDLCTTDGTCTVSGLPAAGACTVDADCTYASLNATTLCAKASRTCDCVNPLFDSTNPICTDPDCTDLCTLRCDDERCVTDQSCADDTDCGVAAPFCSNKQCVQCEEDDDCGEGKSCEDGVCLSPCKHNEECAAFYECNADSGKCEYAGCKSDRECILAATGNNGQAPESVATPSGEDPRLLKCLPSEAEPEHKTCKIPCENDGACGAQSVCDAGFCKFIGCESDEECRVYLGLVGQVPTPARPFVPTAVCR